MKGFVDEQKLKEPLLEEESSTSIEEDFTDYIFKVYLYGYVKKTIIFSAIQIKKKTNQIRKREELTLNVVDPDFQEERLNLISYGEVDFIEEIFQLIDDAPVYNEISHNEEMIKAMDTLTDRQKEILYRCIIKGESDTLVGYKLGISKQGVNKIKKTALKKLRLILGEGEKVI